MRRHRRGEGDRVDRHCKLSRCSDRAIAGIDCPRDPFRLGALALSICAMASLSSLISGARMISRN